MPLSQSSSNHSSMNDGNFMDYLDSVPAGLHLSVENATPKPLRINKQRAQAGPAINSANQDFFVPRRNSSISGTRTTAEIQRVDSAASSSQCSNDTLYVHKRGLTKLSNLCSNKSIQQENFRSRNAMAQFHGLQETCNRAETAELYKTSLGFEASEAHFNNVKAPLRSVTTGSIIPTGLLSPFTEGPLIPLAPTPIVTKYRRRAATTQGPKSSLTTYQQVDQSTNQDLKRQSSLKKRLISRVMSGLSSKQAGSHSTKDCHGSVQVRYEGTTRDISDTSTRESSVGTTEDYSNESTQRSSSGTTQESSNGVMSSRHDSMASSFDASSIWGSELVQNLATFPNPPSLTSPPTCSSMGTTLDGAEISEHSFPSSYIAIPGVEINAVSEISSLNSEDGKSVFVAVELTGNLNQPEDGGAVTAFHHGLEVAVVIDNSLFTSPAALMASCEIARHLAALLVMSDDKLAILSTSPLYPNLPQSRTVQPLNTVDTRRVKLAVDSIVGSTEQPDHEVTIEALECAKNILKRSPATMAKKGGRASFGHIFLLTTNPAGIPSSLLHDERLQIHLINPGTVPWKGQRNVESNGWKLRSLYRSEFEFVSLKKDEDETSLFNRLRNVVSHARSGKISGKLTDLVLEVNAGIDCSIEAVMGKASYLSLQPGEVILALVKVSVGQHYPPLPSSSTESLDSPSNSCALIDELKSLLKASSTTLLTAKLKYKYSLFPSKTRCSITADCDVEREASGVGGDKNILNGPPQQGSPSQVLVQKRLVFHLATYHSPRRAISSILDYFGADGRDSVCPNYIKLVLDELKYQARILERLDPSDVGWITAGDSENLCEHFGQGLFNIPNFKPQEWLHPMATCKVSGGLKEPVSLSQIENKWNTSQTLGQGEVVIRQGSGKYSLGFSEKEHGDDNGSERSTGFGFLSKYSLSARMPTRSSNHRVEALSDEISRYSSEQLDFSQKSTSSEPRTVFREPRAYQKSSSKPRTTSQKTASELRTVSSNTRMNKSDKTDEAHNIWDQMKKISRSNSHRSQKGDLRHPIQRAANSPQVIIVSKERVEQERTRILKQLAVKNQRSVGEETLRSFGRGGAQRKDRRAIGPWAV